ncbi:hypothetical protein ALQ48_200013 [Pseudomonas coronafaciens pv. zizaniae]|nr:hypothetical protein ALQ48_200013 [Pseudomonas coronafaciens pv. zizaniae]
MSHNAPYRQLFTFQDMPRRIGGVEPARITIYRIQVSAFSATWAVLDGRWVENIPNPSWTLPLMKAYGVRGPVP